jgi:hypothetical protein
MATLCDRIATELWFSPGTPVSSTNKSNCYDITEILLKVALNTIIWHKSTKKTISNCNRDQYDNNNTLILR